MIERSENSIPPDAVASGCSHGGEQRMAIPARSHDRARFEEQCEWLRERFFAEVMSAGYSRHVCARVAEMTVADFRMRFESTADANLRAQRGHGEG